MSLIKNIGKKLLGKGIVLTIWRGPLKGMRYRLNQYSALTPLWGVWEPYAQRIFSNLVQAGDCVYDLGANTGIHSMHFCRLSGSNGAVYAFEPIDYNLAEIEIVKAANGLSTLEIMPVAVGAENTTASFTIANHYKGGSLNPNTLGGRMLEVPVTTLDTVVAGGARLPDFIKVDIEGGEGMAMEGMRGVIAQSHPSFYIELHSPEQDLHVARVLQECGYETYRVRTDDAIRLKQQKCLLERIAKMDKSFPDPEGVYGALVAVHAARRARWQEGLAKLMVE